MPGVLKRWDGSAWVPVGGPTTDHGGLGGLLDDDHTNLLNNTRHDVTTRHPLSVLGSDGLGLGLRQIVKFTVSGTFSKGSYPWARAVRVRVVGGGGGGGGVTTATGQGESGGGGGGGYAEALLAMSDLAASETVTVGAGGPGGAAGAAGTDGGASSFGSHAAANGGGGGGGTGSTSGNGLAAYGPGGEATAGDVQIPGGDGMVGRVIAGVSTFHCDGGGSHLAGSTSYNSSGNSSGRTGNLYGGGGSGAIAVTVDAVGGAGADGIVIVELYA